MNQVSAKDRQILRELAKKHLEYANNGSYLEYYLNMKYDTGEEEDIIFFFNEL